MKNDTLYLNGVPLADIDDVEIHCGDERLKWSAAALRRAVMDGKVTITVRGIKSTVATRGLVVSAWPGNPPCAWEPEDAARFPHPGPFPPFKSTRCSSEAAICHGCAGHTAPGEQYCPECTGKTTAYFKASYSGVPFPAPFVPFGHPLPNHKGRKA